MRFSSDLLYRWLRSTGLQDTIPAISTLEVLDGLVPMVSVPGPLTEGLPSATEVQRESFVFAVGRSQAASAAEATDVVATFGRGLWHVHIMQTMHANFTQATSSIGGRILLRNPAGTIDHDIANTWAVNAVPNQVTIEHDFLFSVDSWQVRSVAAATGAGQTLQIRTYVKGNRLN